MKSPGSQLVSVRIRPRQFCLTLLAHSLLAVWRQRALSREKAGVETELGSFCLFILNVYVTVITQHRHFRCNTIRAFLLHSANAS